MSDIQICTNCVMLSTRPRIGFDENGVCNACQWAEEKKNSVDWRARWKQLEDYCEKYRSGNGTFDCIVPVSGGKDSSYVAHKMKHELGMTPLCVHVAPPLPFELGNDNLERFINTGFDCIRVHPNPVTTRTISRYGFIEHGQPLMSWITNVQVVVFKLAIRFGIPFVMFGEDGEVEYGGSSRLKNKPVYDIEDSIELYLSGINPDRYKDMVPEKDLEWWTYPSIDDFRKAGLAIAHWSYFENWDPYEHYIYSKKNCGLKERDFASKGTYNNFAQTDTCLYNLHTYLMYLKFGFGRCTQDVGIDIRRGAMDRRQAVALVNRFDSIYPDEYVDIYLDYFQLVREEFDAVLDRHANRALLVKRDGRWEKSFTVK